MNEQVIGEFVVSYYKGIFFGWKGVFYPSSGGETGTATRLCDSKEEAINEAKKAAARMTAGTNNKILVR